MEPRNITPALIYGAAHLELLVAARRKAILGHILLTTDGPKIEITTAAGFYAERVVPWGGLQDATDPVRYIKAAIEATIEEAVNPKPI